jgi:hypothetical protein
MANLLTAGTEAVQSLPIPPSAYGLLAIAVFGLLLAVTFAFRSVGQRH